MKILKRLLVTALVLAVGFLLYVDVRQAQTIEAQRHLILNMFHFIQAGCPFNQLN